LAKTAKECAKGSKAVAGQGDKGVAARAALAVATKEDAKTFADPCAYFKEEAELEVWEAGTPPAVSSS